MQKFNLLLLLALSLTACAAFPLAGNERTKTYVLTTQASAEGNIQAALRFLKDHGKPADAKENLKSVLFNLKELNLNSSENAIPPGGNTALMELNATGKMQCLIQSSQPALIVEIGKTTFIDFDLTLRVKADAIRLDYSKARVVLADGKPALADFTTQGAVDRALDQCMAPLHKALVNYVNQKSSGW